MGPFEAARESVPARVELLLIWILLALTWITIALRFYVRAFLVRSLGWDDGFMLITSVCRLCAFVKAMADHYVALLHSLLRLHYDHHQSWRLHQDKSGRDNTKDHHCMSSIHTGLVERGKLTLSAVCHAE